MIIKTTGIVTEVINLTETSKELVLTLAEPMKFFAGHFINIFYEVNGEKLRRSYSISSDDQVSDKLSLSIRSAKDGAFSPLLWKEDFTGKTLEVMGPLGVNTADKITQKNVYLFGFGVGAGVIRAVAMHEMHRNDLDSLTIVTGSRAEDDIIHKEYFDALKAHDARVTLRYAISNPKTDAPCLKGYIQDHIDDFDFNNADVYVCGQKVACDALVEKVKSKNPSSCNFFIEAFH